MFSYANFLSQGIFGNDKKVESERYFEMVIEKDNVFAMFNYPNLFSKGFHDDHKIQYSETIFIKTIINAIL
jgi:hypothetical protein